jgi:hypothetical protein
VTARNLKSVIGSLCISLTSLATLEHLKLDIRFIKSICDFDYNVFYEDLGDADVWRHLDSTATHPTGSRLQLERVDININYALSCDDDREEPDMDKVKKTVFDCLPLLRTKGILFIEVVLERTCLG